MQIAVSNNRGTRGPRERRNRRTDVFRTLGFSSIFKARSVAHDGAIRVDYRSPWTTVAHVLSSIIRMCGVRGGGHRYACCAIHAPLLTQTVREVNRPRPTATATATTRTATYCPPAVYKAPSAAFLFASASPGACEKNTYLTSVAAVPQFFWVVHGQGRGSLYRPRVEIRDVSNLSPIRGPIGASPAWKNGFHWDSPTRQGTILITSLGRFRTLPSQICFCF